MLLFRAEQHIDRWCSARDIPRGATLTPEQGWRLAHAWYKDKVKPAEARKPRHPNRGAQRFNRGPQL